MRKIIWQTLAAMTAIMILSAPAWAQFETGHTYIGPHVGLGAYQSAFSFGGDVEYALTKPGKAGPGRIGLSATVDYWRWSGASVDGYYWSYSWVPVGVFGAYHFILDNPRWDLFAGLGLGYLIVHSEYHRPDGGSIDAGPASYSSTAYWSGVAGARYFFSPGLALHGRLGFGAAVIAVGVNVGL